REHISKHFTWKHAVEAAERRLLELRKKPILRLSRPSPVPQVPTPSSAPVSLCMIVKNEEENLAACLQSVQGLVKEMIIVDTGSTDRTKEIAASFGAKVYDFTWIDNFAAARNESLRHATGRWIFWLDADERLDETNRRRLREIFAGLS